MKNPDLNSNTAKYENLKPSEQNSFMNNASLCYVKRPTLYGVNKRLRFP